jgi:hypothetical protein
MVDCPCRDGLRFSLDSRHFVPGYLRNIPAGRQTVHIPRAPTRPLADTHIHSPFAANSAKQRSMALSAFSASGPSAVTNNAAPVRMSAVMISMMLTAEQLRPFASSVMALLKRIAQRTISLVGRACRPVEFVTCILRVSFFAELDAAGMMQSIERLNSVRRGCGEFVLADFLDL